MNAEVSQINSFKSCGLKMRSTFKGEPEINETIRKRLIHARQLNRLDQIEASHVLGYKNSSALSKIESGFAKIPKDFIVKAALAYGVSIDYLMGLSDEPERDPRTAEQHAILNAVRETVIKQAESTVCVLLANAADMTPMVGHVQSMITAMATVFEKFDTVCMRNQQFQEDVLAGSSLQRAIDEAHSVSNAAKRFMQRRESIVDARMKTAAEGGSYPLFSNLIGD